MRPLDHRHIHHFAVQGQGTPAGGLGFLPGRHDPPGVGYFLRPWTEGGVDGINLRRMNGELAGIAQLPGHGGVPRQSFRIAESYIRPIQGGDAGGLGGDGNSSPGQINLLSVLRAGDTHIISVILRAKGQSHGAE